MNKKQITRLPTSNDRTVIVGRTGSGKTQAGVWHLSNQNIDTMPWVIIDAKGDDLINAIKKAQYITYDDPLPKKPGIYILKIAPREELELSDWFTRVYQRGNLGVYIDEGFMMGQRNKAFETCQTQGRSLRIPMITLTQRPCWVSQFVFSEANYWQVFDLIKKGDRDRVAEDIPISRDYDLPEFCSYYYDVGKKNLVTLAPVPEAEKLLAIIDAKLPKIRRTL